MNFKVMYWRPKKISRPWLCLSLAVSLSGMLVVQQWTKQISPADQESLLAAATKANAAMRLIAEVRAQQGHKIVPDLDPQGSHLIGPSMSRATSKLGSLESKQTSINPNFAAVVVQWLKDAGVRPGDRIAIGASGSWPALNIAVYAAADTLGLRPTIVLSAASSQYGANSAKLTWVDMEHHLRAGNVIPFQAVAASLGGLHDRADGMTDETRAILVDTVQRNGVTLLQPDSTLDSINQRMALYDSALGTESYAAFINVGGGSASIGGTKGQQFFTAGVHRLASQQFDVPDCVASRMLKRGTTVINVGDVVSVAKRYGFPIAPATAPVIGQGSIFGKPVYRRWLVALVMGITWLAMTITVAPGWWLRGKQWVSSVWHREQCDQTLPPQVDWMI